MKTYDLYLESGPKRRKTMVHVLELLGCIANGPTTEAALEATPEAIRAFQRFLSRHGDEAGAGAPFDTRVAEHITEGDWLGNGSPYIVYAPDLLPMGEEDLERYIQRFAWLRGYLADWAAQQTETYLDAEPAGGGRTARHILLHVLSVPGAYISAAVGGTTGFSRLHTLAERGELPLPVALREVEAMAADRLRRSTPEERSRVIERPKDTRTLRKAIRRMLEHEWEHLAELSRRPGGPEL